MDKTQIAIKVYEELMQVKKELEEEYSIKIRLSEYVDVEGERFYFDSLDIEDDIEN